MTNNFSIDLADVIRQMKKIIEKPRFIFTIDKNEDVTQVYIRPIRQGIYPESRFEKEILKEILQECHDGFLEFEFPERIRVELEPEILEEGADKSLLCATSLGGVLNQIKKLR